MQRPFEIDMVYKIFLRGKGIKEKALWALVNSIIGELGGQLLAPPPRDYKRSNGVVSPYKKRMVFK